MRCVCCDKRLSDYESTIKHAETGVYMDICIDCLSEIAHDVPIPVKANKKLVHLEETQEDYELDQLTPEEYNKYSKGLDEDY